MKAIEFKEQNKIYAKDQPQYHPLPGYENGDDVISCHRFTFIERLRVLFGANLWLSEKMFGNPLTPIYITVDKWDMFEKKL